MTDFARINQPRVDKILGALDMISKSAASQKVPDDEIAALLAPVAARLVPVEAKPVPSAPRHERVDISLWKEAQTAPLKDLMMAWSTINARLLDEIA